MLQNGAGAWEPSQFSVDFPFYFRIGSIGAGVGIGCGLGVGFGRPLNLGAAAGMGQAVAGVSSGLGQVSDFLGGAGTGAREAVRRLGIKGLDAGLGCGVGIGYGFGAGLFVKPSAAEQLMRLIESTAGRIVRHVQLKLQEAGIQLPVATQQQHRPEAAPVGALDSPGPPDGAYPSPGLQSHPAPSPPPYHRSYTAGQDISPLEHLAPLSPPSLSGSPLAGQLPDGLTALGGLPAVTMLLPPALSGRHSASGLALPPGSIGGADNSRRNAGLYGGTAAASPPVPAGGSVRGEATPEEFRALLRHEREITRLKAQNRALRRAVCKLDRRLPLCKEPSEDEDGRSGMG